MCTLCGLSARGCQRPPCTVEARREGASPQNSAARLSSHPQPVPGADPSRSGAAPEPRWPPAIGGGSVSPPAPSPGSPASRPGGPRPTAPGVRASPYLKTRSRRRVRAYVCLKEFAGACAPQVRYIPLGSAGGEPWSSGLPEPCREQGLRRPAEGARAVPRSTRERGRTRAPDRAAVGCCARAVRPGFSAPRSGSLPAGHVGFTTAQNTSV